jgi:HPt (histidine-containing phosphotransfer) domain-containing protein
LSRAREFRESRPMVATAASHSDIRDYSASEGAFDEAGDEPVIDLVHLARQTDSDQALEMELLEMFERQSGRIASQLVQAGAGDGKLCGELAHMLKGSALAIGAGRVARSARAYEAVQAAGSRGGASGAALDELVDAVAEARAAIARLLG